MDNTQSLISKKILTLCDMALTTVKVSNKGQIAIPASVREEIGVKEGDTLVLFNVGNRILLERAGDVEKAMKDDMKDIAKLSETSLKKLWGNKKDDVWGRYLK